VFKSYGTGLTAPPAAFAFGDGDLWFTEPTANRIGHLRIDRTLEEFHIPTPDAGVVGIAATFTASGTYVWFTESSANRIGRIAPDGTITEFPVPTPSSQPWGIANDIFSEQIWFTERAGNAVATIDVDGAITERRIPTPGVSPTEIAFVGVAGGEDVWIASSARNSVGRLPFPSYDTFEEIVLPQPASEPFSLATAADGTLWFTERSADRIGRIGQDLALTEFALQSGSRPTVIAGNPFGGEFLWFTETGANRVAAITLDGQVTEYTLPANVSGPSGMLTDGNLAWFGALTPPSIVRAQPDEQLFVGAGMSGPWQSTIELAGTEPAERTVFLGAYPFPPQACPGQCFGFTAAELPAFGAVSIAGPFFGGFLGSDFATVFERPLRTGFLPAAHFRFANTERLTQSADAPVTRLSAVAAHDPALLAFPSASHSPSSKSNLFLSDVGIDGPLTVHVEAFAPSGASLGAVDATLEASIVQVLGDVLGRFGAGSVENAQVRVTKTGGEGLLWGMLATVVGENDTLSISSGTNFAAADDTVLIGGGGVAGSWDTVIDLANPLSDGIAGAVRKSGACPPECGEPYAITGDGTTRVLASSFLSGAWAQPRLLATTGAAVVHARVINRANPTQAADLPTIPLSQLRAANADVLVFPSARRGDGVRTNLFLVGVGDGDPIRARVEVLSADGAILATSEVGVTSWDEPGSTFVVDALGQLGIDALALGQVRVSRESGGQLLWGVLSNVYADGRLSVIPPELR
jgi:virginiamycin B lyase